jgi:hypothetical protein
MNKLQKLFLVSAITAMASYIAYGEAVKLYQAQKTKWITAGAMSMRQAVFEAVSKGEVQLSDGEGKQTITIIKK